MHNASTQRENQYHENVEHANELARQFAVRSVCQRGHVPIAQRSSLPSWWLHGAHRPPPFGKSPRSRTLSSLSTRCLALATSVEAAGTVRLDAFAAARVWPKPAVRSAQSARSFHSHISQSSRALNSIHLISLLSKPEIGFCRQHHSLPRPINFTAMPISSRFTVDIPQCSIQSWILGPPTTLLSDYKAWIDSDDPSHFVTLSGARLLAKRIAVGLRQHGVQPGERVLIYSGNSIYFPVLVLGIWMAGCVFTGANPGFTARELAFQLRDSQANVMIAASQNGKTALEAAQACGMDVSKLFLIEQGNIRDSDPDDAPVRADDKLTMPRSWTHLIASEAQGHDFHWNEPENSEAAVCTLNYSSGTVSAFYISLPSGIVILTCSADRIAERCRDHSLQSRGKLDRG